MTDSVDYYDVERMIRDACVQLRSEINAAVSELRDDLSETHRYLQGECDSIMRTVNSRTEHLV
jgi:hypothetical protein